LRKWYTLRHTEPERINKKGIAIPVGRNDPAGTRIAASFSRLQTWHHMTNVPAARSLMSTLDDDAWDDLLNFIEERRVIPIVGPELLMVSTDRAIYTMFASGARGFNRHRASPLC
jgi:hypothetical protein